MTIKTMKTLKTAVLAAVAAFAFRADASALDKCWAHILYNFKKDSHVVSTTNIIATAKAHGYTGVILASSCGLGMLHMWDDERRERLMTVKRACDEAGLEIAVGVWSIGYAKECFFPIDPNLSAAAPVFDTRYRVSGGKCVHLPAPARELLDAPGRLHSPRQSADVADRLVTVKPHRSYRLTIRASSPKGRFPHWPIGVSVRRPGAKTDYIETRAYKVKTDGTEQEFTLNFASLAETEVNIVCRGYNRTFPGHVELKALTLEEIQPLVVIRRHGTPVTVRNVKTGLVYEEGRDYAPVPRAKTVWPGPWVKGADRFAIVPLKNGRMKDGDELSVDCYCPFPTWGKWASACMAAPELEPIMEASAAEIVRTLNPRLWFLSLDEIRTGGGCRDCLKIGDMAHVFAAFVEKSMKIVRRHSPDAEFMVWNDMVDPFCMNDNGENAGLYSTMDGVWDLLPKDLGIGYWTYRPREKGMKFFSERGHKTLVCGYYDEKVLKRSIEWADLALRTPGCVGIAYCTWGDNWKLLGDFGDMVRRKADQVSAGGIYPHLAMYNDEGECGTGALLPWAGSLWAVTYAPHAPCGSSDRLYRIAPDLTREIHPASVGGTPANRIIHRESDQAMIGPYVIDSKGAVRTVPPAKMPGRLTAAARHLTDPTNKIYVATMDNGLYELDLRTLAFKTLLRDQNGRGGWADVKIAETPDWASARENKLPGSHAKGMSTGYGRIFIANNGEYVEEARTNPRIPAGVLASTDAAGGDQQVIRRSQFTDVTTPDGVYGNEHPDKNPVWSLGWDAKSVLLACRVKDGWSYYRLPKASHTYDGAHGWNTEWPRIREIGEDDLLATMHGTLWRFPRGFRPGAAAGIRPRSTFLKITGDFCRWGERIVFGCDDSARSEFMNKRRAKGSLKGPALSQSNLWFVDPSRLDDLGPRSGWAGVFDREDVAEGTAGDSFLAAGYDFKWLWLSGGEFDVEVDEKGDGEWKKVRRVSAGGTDLSGVKGEWLRLVARAPAKKVSASLFYRSADDRSGKGELAGVSVAVPGGASGVLHVNGRTPGRLALAVSGTTGYAIDGKFRLEPVSAETAAGVTADAAVPENVLGYDRASVLYTDDKGRRWRLPYGNPARETFAGSRVCREVCTERDHFNAAGIYYELPAENAHGFAGVRPVSTHNLPIKDYCSWRGLFALSLPGEVRLMAVDDMWKAGKARGYGGPWFKTKTAPGVPSDAYLMNGFDRKKLALVADTEAKVTLEVDIDGWGTWVEADSFALKPGKRVTKEYPRAFSAYWVRFKCDRPATVTAQFKYD